MKPNELSLSQLNAFSTIERVNSVLSLIGCAFIAITFLGSKEFHKPINRLVFYASMGNVFTNIATIIARATVEGGNFGGPLCQLQSFLIQMFMPADAYWTFAMAMNVYLTFYHKYGAVKLRKLEKWYFLACYGIPFIPALVYIFVSTKEKGRMYGNATLWCWIANEWDIFRIITFYGPVWVVILFSMFIYARAGKDIYKKRQALRNFNIPPPDPMSIMKDPFSGNKSTDVYVTHETAVSTTTVPDSKVPQQPDAAIGANGYSCNITSAPAPGSPDSIGNSLQTRWSYTEKPLPQLKPSATPPVLAHQPNAPNSNLYPTRRYATMEANNAIWSYTKVAVLFFAAMMITWIPSSANRVYSVVHPGQISVPLQFASAFVLPLQGFWNAVIYTVTSLPACKKVWSNMKSGNCFNGRGRLLTMAAAFSDNDRENTSNRTPSRRKGLFADTESMTELQQSRRPSTGYISKENPS